MDLLKVTSLLKKLPPLNVHTWIDTWEPGPFTTKWTSGPGGAFYRSPLAVWTNTQDPNSYDVPAESVAAFAARMQVDWYQRNLFEDSCLDPDFDSLKPTPDGKNLWDPLHFGGCAILDDLDERGFSWAGNAMLRLVSSYWINENASYLRDGGKGPYMDQGRLRCAGWILHALYRVSRMFKRWGYAGPWADFVVSLVNEHVTRIDKNWPLIAVPDGPDGDHLSVPHLEVFMLGMLGNGLRLIQSLGYDVHGLPEKAAALITAALVPGRPVITYVYDLRVTDTGEPLPAEPTDPTREGCSGVNLWIPGACSDEEQALLHADAVKQNLHLRYPWIYAHHFNAVKP